MVKDGKIYLSLSDAIALALENNYDIAIARYDLSIADTDILRTKTGAVAARRALRPDRQHAGRFLLDSDHGRRPGRNDGRLGRRGFGHGRLDAHHRRRRPTPGESGPDPGVDHLSSIATARRQRASSPAAPVRPTTTTSPSTRASSPAPIFRSPSTTPTPPVPTRRLNSAPVELQLQGHGDAAPAAGRGHLGQQALHVPGAQRPPHCRFVVPPADSLHREPGGDHLLGPGAGLRGCAGQGACSGPEHPAAGATTRSSCRSAPWRRSMWSTPNRPWPPTSRR